MSDSIAITSGKGGVGKTTTAINIATCLAEIGNNVLVIDFDPQGNATSALGVDPTQFSTSIYEVILGNAQMRESIIKTKWPSVSLAPANRDLSGAEIELVAAFNRERFLKKAIEEVIEE